MNFFHNMLKGLVMGIGAIAPGVSGGVIAVIFGLYEKLNEVIAHFFKDIKHNILFLLPIVLGAGVGVFSFSGIINYLFKNHNVEVRFLFIGLMVGTFPMLVNQANKQGFKIRYVSTFILALASTILFSIIENGSINMTHSGEPTLLHLIIYGSILGFGTIIPGISASFVLMYIGAYEVVLEAVSTIDLGLLIPIGVGSVLSIALFAKLIVFLFDKSYGYTYYAVLGFVVGSIIPVFPGLQVRSEYLIGFSLCVIGFYVSLSLSKFAPE